MTTKQNKGFTLLEILLVIAAIGILAAIVLVAINPNRQIAQVRNTVRQADINTIQKAVEQYLIEKGSYPNGITTTYREICNTGSNNNTQGTVSNECIDLRELVPDYIASIPVNPSTSTHSGYYAWINDINNKVAVLAGKGENGKVIGINHLKENIVTDGLVLHLDAGNLASYPGTGNTWFDLSGNGNNGLYTGSPILYQSGALITPSSQTSRWIRMPEAALQSLPSGTVWTLEWGMTVLSHSGTRYAHSMASPSTDNLMIWQIDASTMRLYQGNLQSGFNPTYQIGVPITLTLTRNGNIHRIYKDGVFAAQYSSSNLSQSTVTGWVLDQEQDTVLGGFDSGQNTHAEWYFNRLYSRILTDIEIQQNFNATRGRFGL